MAFVYWIHLPEHTDIFSEGYVGVTIKSVEDRWKCHCYSADEGSDYHIHRAIRKYRDKLIVKTILEGPENYCYEVEARLRPKAAIGFNMAPGGGSSPVRGVGHSKATKEKLSSIGTERMKDPAVRKAISEKVRGFKHTSEAKKKISEATLGRKHKEESILRMSASQKARNRSDPSWCSPRSDKSVWALALDVFKYLQEHAVGSKKTAKHFQLPHGKIKTIWQKVQDGWNPSEDTAYLSWVSEFIKQKECHGTQTLPSS